MAREEILAMAAGKELDALVAEKVMGFPNVHKFYHRYVYDNVGSLGHVAGRIDVNEYSTDISAAWEVLSKFSVHEIIRTKNGVTQACIVGKSGWWVSENTNDNVPEAICKAALLAVMEDRV